jgi:hypothetical protein
MLILEERDRKKMILSIAVLILIILGVMGLLFFWSLSISGFSMSSIKSIPLPQFSIGSKEKTIESTNIETRIFKDSKFKVLRSYEVLPVREGSFGKTDPFAAPFSFSQEEFSNQEVGNSEPFR